VPTGDEPSRREMMAQYQASEAITRRSTRVQARIPIRITSLDPSIGFSLSCETMVVNVHGCAARIRHPVDIGVPVRLETRDNQASARILDCQPAGNSLSNWVVTIELEKPGNIWGLAPFPDDWAQLDLGTAESTEPARAPLPAVALKMPIWPLASPSAKAALPEKRSHQAARQQPEAQPEAIAKLLDRLASLEVLPEEIRKQLAESQQQLLAQVREEIQDAVAHLAKPSRR